MNHAVLFTLAILANPLCIAQELPYFQKREIPSGPVVAYFSIGNLVFGYEQSQMPGFNGNASTLSLEKAISLALPPATVQNLIDLFAYNDECDFQFTDASFGTSTRNCWYIRHTILPRNMGFSGTPYEYLAVIDQRGRVISPRTALVSRFGQKPKQFVSAMTLDRLLDNGNLGDPLLEDKAKAIADERVNEFLMHANAIMLDNFELRFHASQKISLADGMGFFWQFDYTDGSVRSTGFESHGTLELISVWVYNDSLHSKITLNRWYFDEQIKA